MDIRNRCGGCSLANPCRAVSTRRGGLRVLINTLLMLPLISTVPQVFAASNDMPNHPRIVMIIAPKDFTDQEYFEPRAIFEKAGANIKVASISTEPATSHASAKVKVDQAIADVKLDQFDAVAIVGGMGAVTYLMNDEHLRNLLVAADKSNKVVSAICIGPAVLARAGILRNREATCYSDKIVLGILKMNGAVYLDKTVVVSGKIITGNGPNAAKEFATKVLEQLRNG
jgi:protease I